MLKAIFLILAFSTAFANPDLDDQEFWPFSESPSDLSGSANLEVTLNDEASKDSDQNLFMDSSATVGEYPKLETQLNAAEANDDDGLLAGLGRPSEPFDPFDPFGFDNNAGPPESNIAQPPDFPVPDCGARYLLCCSGKPFGGGMYSKCSWCMHFNPIRHNVQREAGELEQIYLIFGTQMMKMRRTARLSTFSFAANTFL